MKFTAIFLIVVCMQVHAKGLSQVTISEKNVPLQKVFKEIKKQTGYDFLYSVELLQKSGKVSIDVQNVSLEKALHECLKDKLLTYALVEKTIVIKPKAELVTIPIQETATAPLFIDVKGVVTDANGKPLADVSVVISGSRIGTSTNNNGEYMLANADPKSSIVFSMVGYSTQSFVVGSKTVINVALELNISEQEEVVINSGYQTISKERATGSYAVVTEKDMEVKLQTNILDRLEGLAAGLTSYKGNIQIRGTSTINGNADPLIVVDGVPFEGSLAAINPNEVTSITVLKDATAASIYGARSANGIIVITTRRGMEGPLRISLNSTVKFTPLPDRDYLNQMSSQELVDFQYDMFNKVSGNYNSIDPRKSMNDVYRLMYEKKAGNITESELQTQLDVYRNQNRYDQIKDELVNSHSILQQHNIAFSGGSKVYQFNLSANYQQSNPYEKEQSNNRLGYNLKNNFTLTKWLSADIGIIGSNTSADYDNGFNGYSNLTGGRASYYMLRNSDGTPAQWYNSKSQFEIDRLNGLGLQDETYRPLDHLSMQHYTATSKYNNLNIGASFKLFDGLSFDVRYQTERTENYTKQLHNKDAQSVTTQINDATVINADNSVKMYIPVGGQLNETRGDLNSYTLRGQFNYTNTFANKHDVRIIAGGERRKIASSSTNVYKYGYDDYNLNYKPIDELLLSQYIYNTQALFNQYRLTREENGFRYVENRFVSFFGNGSYTFNRKLTASGSIRMDQSNLFGTDPQYQYKPLWSAGLKYKLLDNKFDWLDNLAVRATYGINGNIAKNSGPYLIAQDLTNLNYYTGDFQSSISSPPNSGLRWEKTNVLNFGVDFRMFNNVLSGSIEYYSKNTSDLLGNLTSDPTLGWSSIVVNYGNMYNRGTDITLTSQNIRSKNLSWSTTLNFNYNKNELTKLENSSNTVTTYINSAQNRVGKPMGALYSIDYVGLNNIGRPIALKSDKTEVTSAQNLSVEDLIYNGTSVPPYSASLLNTVKYKDFDLFFMFIYYGGHVMRDVRSVYLSKLPELNYTTNMDRNVLNYWKTPGDELNPDVTPAFYNGASANFTNIWHAANNGIQNADYIKLRDVTLSYNYSGRLIKSNTIKGIRLSLQMQNVWRWAANDQNLDPEVWSGTSLTPSRGSLIPPTYTFGLSVNF